MGISAAENRFQAKNQPQLRNIFENVEKHVDTPKLGSIFGFSHTSSMM